MDAQTPRKIWDLPTRLFHWLLVACIAGCWTTAELFDDQMQLHLWLGYATLGLIVFRIVWGLIGSRHARFWSFLSGPVTVWRYFRSLFDGTHAEAPGHNPMGGWMVAILLAIVSVQVATGLFADDDIVLAGPWTGAVSRDLAEQLTELHHLNFNVLLGAIALHVTAIVFYALVLKSNLVGPMITGRKAVERVSEGAGIAGTPWLRTLLAVVVAGAAVFAVLEFAPEPPASDIYGMEY